MTWGFESLTFRQRVKYVFFVLLAPLAQLVECVICNYEVVSSNLIWSSILISNFSYIFIINKFKIMKKTDIKNNLSKILNGEIKFLYSSTLRQHLIKNNSLGEYKCNKCGIKEWNNSQITLELEHIDGDRNNNIKSNLEWLCPNCHSQTSTYKSKNRIRNTNIILDEQDIIQRVKNKESIKNILISYGLRYEGNSYSKIYQILIKNNIEVPSYNPSKSEQLARSIIYNNNKTSIKIQELTNNIINSNIDFNKPGWGIEVSHILKCSPQYAVRWVKKHMPTFYEEKCWSQQKNQLQNKQLESIKNEKIIEKNKQLELIKNNVNFNKLGYRKHISQLLDIPLSSVNGWLKWNYYNKLRV